LVGTELHFHSPECTPLPANRTTGPNPMPPSMHPKASQGFSILQPRCARDRASASTE
jgi:hypothetical protein